MTGPFPELHETQDKMFCLLGIFTCAQTRIINRIASHLAELPVYLQLGRTFWKTQKSH